MSQSNWSIVYVPPEPIELPPVEQYKVGTILQTDDGVYYELLGWLDSLDHEPTRPASWSKVVKARARYLKRKGVIPK